MHLFSSDPIERCGLPGQRPLSEASHSYPAFSNTGLCEMYHSLPPTTLRHPAVLKKGKVSYQHQVRQDCRILHYPLQCSRSLLSPHLPHACEDPGAALEYRCRLIEQSCYLCIFKYFPAKSDHCKGKHNDNRNAERNRDYGFAKQKVSKRFNAIGERVGVHKHAHPGCKLCA